MGAVCAGPTMSPEEERQYQHEKQAQQHIEKVLVQAKTDDSRIIKLLLLGAGESGKSTLFKQLMYLYGANQFSDEVRAPFASVIYANVISSMKQLCEQTNVLPEELGCQVSPSVVGSKNFILNEVRVEEEVNEEVARHIALLWQDSGIRQCFRHRARFQLLDSCRYFFEKIEAVGAADYLPTYQDVLQCRARTTGIVEKDFTMLGNHFRMVDVGGQRNERRKWIHCFEQVTAVIFVAAINEFDQLLYEDGKTNRIVEAVDLFDNTCNSEYFQETSMILFLNKRDLFHEKIVDMGIDMGETFSDYHDGCNEEKATKFITDLFLQCNRNPDKQIYVHVTCATDTSNIDFTFNVVKDIIIKNRMRDVGLYR